MEKFKRYQIVLVGSSTQLGRCSEEDSHYTQQAARQHAHEYYSNLPHGYFIWDSREKIGVYSSKKLRG